ncbi:MAG: hypothetical protein AB7T06_36570 [Kofleriaceae bacterium]
MRCLVAVLLSACEPFDVCDVVVDVPVPARLSETGLDEPEVRAYTPSFALWSDGAEKQRWLYLPPGSTIDTSDPDDWVFPIGTRAWKQFSVAGVRIETRMIQRLADGTWADIAYAWQPDQQDAIADEAGTTDAAGTPHDIPSAGQCRACHGGRASHLLGISTIQLAHPAAPEELSLDELIATGRLSEPPEPPVIPGDETARTALGYLHANCSHCHNDHRPARTSARCYDPENDVDFLLETDSLSSVLATPAYATAKERHERMVELMSRRGADLHMPPLATETVDREGLAAVEAWIRAL